MSTGGTVQRSRSSRERVRPAIDAALRYIASKQDESGAWKGDYGGPLFLIPMFVGVHHVMEQPIEPRVRDGIVRYLKNHQNRDGGFGLHVEGQSTVFTSVLNYVALRLLGCEKNDPALVRAREWFLPRGGGKALASWGKFALALLDLYEYDGLNPVPPELWLLPYEVPFHPGRMWCHCRMVYLPMSYLYGKRVRARRTPLIDAIRSEIYDQPYETIDFRSLRETVSETDVYVPHSPLLRIANRLLGVAENHHPKMLRERALDLVLDHIRREDENTSYICIGPINKLYNMLVWHVAKPGGEEVRRHLERIGDYLWEGDDGIKMQGYNSSELWDTAFAVQAIIATGEASQHHAMIAKAHRYIESNQVLEDTPDREKYFRDPSRGGWPFSDRAHGWPITDCTAEGLKASLLLERLVDDPISEERLVAAVDMILYWQNLDGSWATYEQTRGPKWLELLNPSDIFADIMIDYGHVECTSACVQALAAFRTRHPNVRRAEIDRAIDRGRHHLLGRQREDGSFEGAWGICFTYGTFFGVWGLRAAGLGPSHPAIARACDYLERVQLSDGGWGERAESCSERRYVPTEESQAVMTGWALLALCRGGRRDSQAVRRGVDFLLRRQRSDGSFPPEHIAGVFNRTSGIHYDNYLKIFPLWALAEAGGRSIG